MGVTIPATGSGDATPKVATDPDGSTPVQHYQLMKQTWGPAGTFNMVDSGSGKPLPVQIRAPTGEDMSTSGKTCSTDITRPADTTAYAANDVWADSTTAPTTGGFTFSSAARVTGGSGIITDAIIISSVDPATLLQGELWIFDQAVTAVNDNAAFSLADADAKNLVAVLPFTLATTQAGSGANSFAHLQNLSIGYTCVGTANLRYLVKVKNAYTPASAEVLTSRIKCVYEN